jgi:tRNA threonylcarbamoyladenosine biosynthesis protein TsaE
MQVKNADELIQLGERLGQQLRGGEVIELRGDVGAGKTTLVKGLARGLQIDEDIQSPSFTISRVYGAESGARDGLSLSHYDFYRLPDAGLMRGEIAETIADPHAVTVVEWSESVRDVLPKRRLIIQIDYLPDQPGRALQFTAPQNLAYLTQNLV